MDKEVCRSIEEFYEMVAAVEMKVQTEGYICDDGHQLTEEEFYRWTAKEVLEAYHKLFEKGQM